MSPEQQPQESFIIHDESGTASDARKFIGGVYYDRDSLDDEFDRLLGAPITLERPPQPKPTPQQPHPAQQQHRFTSPQHPLPLPSSVIEIPPFKVDVPSSPSQVQVPGNLKNKPVSTEALENPFLNAEVVGSVQNSHETLNSVSNNRLDMPTEFLNYSSSAADAIKDQILRHRTDNSSFKLGNNSSSVSATAPVNREPDTVIADLEYHGPDLGTVNAFDQETEQCDFDLSFQKISKTDDSADHASHKLIAGVPHSPGTSNLENLLNILPEFMAEVIKGLEEVKRKMEELELQNSRLKMSIGNVASQQSTANAPIDSSLEHLSTLKFPFSVKTIEILELTNTIVSLKSRITILKRRLDYAQFIENSLMKERNGYIETIKQLREQMMSNGTLTEEELRKQLSIKDQRIQKLETALSGSGMGDEKLLRQIEDQRNEITRLRAQIGPVEILHKTVETQEKQIAELRAMVASLKNTVPPFQSEYFNNSTSHNTNGQPLSDIYRGTWQYQHPEMNSKKNDQFLNDFPKTTSKKSEQTRAKSDKLYEANFGSNHLKTDIFISNHSAEPIPFQFGATTVYPAGASNFKPDNSHVMGTQTVPGSVFGKERTALSPELPIARPIPMDSYLPGGFDLPSTKANLENLPQAEEQRKPVGEMRGRSSHKKIELAMSNELLRSHLKQELKRKILTERKSNLGEKSEEIKKPLDPFDITGIPRWQLKGQTEISSKILPEKRKKPDSKSAFVAGTFTQVSSTGLGTSLRDENVNSSQTNLKYGVLINPKPASHKQERLDIRKSVRGIESKGNFPFIASGNERTFSLPANVQKVWAMLKNHDPQSCNVCSFANKRTDRSRSASKKVTQPGSIPPSKSLKPSAVAIDNTIKDADVKETINFLEKNYQAMSDQYEQFLVKYKSIPSALLVPSSAEEKEQIADQMKSLLKSMENASAEITKLRGIQRTHLLGRASSREPRSRSVASGRSLLGFRSSSAISSQNHATYDYNQLVQNDIQNDLQEMTSSLEQLGRSHSPVQQSQHRNQYLQNRLSPAKVALDVFRDAKRVQRRLHDWEEVDHSIAFGGRRVS